MSGEGQGGVVGLVFARLRAWKARKVAEELAGGLSDDLSWEAARAFAEAFVDRAAWTLEDVRGFAEDVNWGSLVTELCVLREREGRPRA